MLFISDIQHFSVGDGDGIRTTVFFGGCPLHCPWCHNPEMIPRREVTLHFASNGKTEVRGRNVTAEEILPELLEDIDFYKTSGGGVTLSGGEVLLQADGAAELSRMLLDQGVSVLIDTAGNVPYSAFQAVDPYVSGYLYDYKSGSPQKYADIIGGKLSLITDNLANLLSSGKPVRIRIPLIPGFNTDAASIDEICRNLTALGLKAVDLLPFHRLGSSKYTAMGLDYLYKDTQPLQKAQLEEIRKRYAEHFAVTIEA